MKNKNIVGLTLIIYSILVWLIDRTTLSISTYLGELYCNKNYMRSVDGVIGDKSCGFNTRYISCSFSYYTVCGYFYFSSN